MPIETIIPAYQPPKSEDGLGDVDVTELDLSTYFEENAPQQEEIIHKVNERPRKEYLQESPELHRGWHQELSTKVFT